MRRNIRRQMQLGLVALFLSCLALFYLVIAVALIQTAKGESVITERPTPQQTLPQKCAEFYNDGTDQWIDCMGVGYK
jgi:hypothetical protein